MINFSTFAYLLVVPLVLLVSNRYIHEKRIHSLGWRAPQISTLLPLGVPSCASKLVLLKLTVNSRLRSGLHMVQQQDIM